MDIGYDYIVLSPGGSYQQSRADYLRSTTGLAADAELDAMRRAGPKLFMDLVTGPELLMDLVVNHNRGSTFGGEMDRALQKSLSRRFGWRSGDVGCQLVPGYSDKYDGMRLMAFCDDNFQKLPDSQLPPNVIGGEILMNQPGKTRGAIVFCADAAFAAQVGKSAEIRITRRDVLSVAAHNRLCGQRGTISYRVHFGNILEAEKRARLSAQGYRSVYLAGGSGSWLPLCQPVATTSEAGMAAAAGPAALQPTMPPGATSSKQ